MNLSFKNRIAFYYMIATAIIMACAFFAIYFVVRVTVMRNLDNDLSYEAQKHTHEIKMIGDSIAFKNKAEWEEREHREIQVNPVFLQLIDKNGRIMDKSPNLKDDSLTFDQLALKTHFDTKLSKRAIRQVQIPIEEGNETKGYIIAAMSSEAAQSVFQKMYNVLITSYLIILVGLYFISRFLAGRSIKPVQEVTKTIRQITKNNLNERVVLPQYKDEIYELSSDFNALLDRIENAMEREKQFTSDASHELRTPLTTLRGTLEVLIRKPRTQTEYEEKVKYSLGEIIRMTNMLEQLLLLARLDTSSTTKKNNLVLLPTLIDEALSYFKNQIVEKNLTIDFQFDQDTNPYVPQHFSKLILDNLLSNAIKYSHPNSTLKIRVESNKNEIVCCIQDQGIGIKEADLLHIYENFFRSDYLNHKHIQGNGLGLSIAKKCADAIHAKLTLTSELKKGTTVTISFPSIPLN